MATQFSQKIKNVGRLTHILNIFARYGFKKEIESTEFAGMINDATQELNFSRARRLRMAFEELGPTFVKLGQLLAAREDMLPKVYLHEFKRLQDRAKPFSTEQMHQILDQEFAGRKDEFFASIDPKPIGAASIGQVHFATLHTGEKVVLKVQRPEVESIVRADLSILLGMASILEKNWPELKDLRPTIILEELKKSILVELDYHKEAANTARMRGLFADNPRIQIPKVYTEFSTRRVLCMEAISGKKLTELEPEHTNQTLVKIGVLAFLDMTFKFGMFHADLHPGNLILTKSGQLAILDFGLTARLSRDTRNSLSYLFVALIQSDFETFSRIFVDLTDHEEDIDRSKLEMEVQEIVDSATALSIRDLHLGKLLMQVARVCATNKAQVTRELILFFRALIALESFGRSLDPEFQVLAETAEYSKSLSKTEMGPKKFLEQESILLMRDSQALIKELPGTLKTLSKRLKSGQFNLKVQSDDITVLARELDRASNRVSLALLLGALVLGSSIVTYGQQGKLFDSLANMGLVGFGVAACLGLWLVVSILRTGHYK